MKERTQENLNFITILSWILIVLSGFLLLIVVMQNILANVMFNSYELERISNAQEGLPGFFFSNFKVFLLLFGLIILYTFMCSIGLLKRKNWARLSYIGLFGFGILYVVIGVIIQWDNVSHFRTHKAEFNTMFLVMKIFIITLTLGFSILFGWLIKKLSSSNIKKEFNT